MMHLPLDDVYIAMGPGEHDRTFDHADDVPSHLTSVLIARQTAIRRSLVQVNSEFQSHLVETLSQPFAKRRMRITERCAEIPDQAASLSVASPDDHLAHGIQAPKNPIKRIVVAIGGQAFFNPVQRPASFFHVVIDHCETQLFLTFEMMEKRAAGHLSGFDDFVHLGVMKPFQRKHSRRLTQNPIARLDSARLFRSSHTTLQNKQNNLYVLSWPTRECKWVGVKSCRGTWRRLGASVWHTDAANFLIQAVARIDRTEFSRRSQNDTSATRSVHSGIATEVS